MANNVLRPYQMSAVSAVREHWLEHLKSRQCIVAPTGAGKTVAMEDLLRESRYPVIFVHTKTLQKQTKRRIPWAWCLTIQSAISPSKKGIKIRKALAKADMAVIDECHHIVSEEFVKVLEPLSSARLFGVTATPIRADKTPLGDVFDNMVQMGSYSQLIRDGWLVPCDVRAPDISRKEQKRLKIRPNGVSSYLAYGRREGGGFRPGIYFDTTKKACEEAAEEFISNGVRAAVITSGTKDNEREKLFGKYANGELDMLCSPMVLAEGFDLPRAEVCILRRGCDNVGLFIQCVGRVLRPYPGKARALLIDVCDACAIHGRPTDDRHYSLEGEAMKTVEETEREAREYVERQEAEKVEAGFRLVADTIEARYNELVEAGRDKGYKPAWASYKLTAMVGIKAPQTFFSKSQSVCLECRHRVTVGDPIFWTGPREVMHPKCWFAKVAKTEPTAREWARGAAAQ